MASGRWREHGEEEFKPTGERRSEILPVEGLNEFQRAVFDLQPLGLSSRWAYASLPLEGEDETPTLAAARALLERRRSALTDLAAAILRCRWSDYSNRVLRVQFRIRAIAEQLAFTEFWSIKNGDAPRAKPQALLDTIWADVTELKRLSKKVYFDVSDKPVANTGEVKSRASSAVHVSYRTLHGCIHIDVPGSSAHAFYEPCSRELGEVILSALSWTGHDQPRAVPRGPPHVFPKDSLGDRIQFPGFVGNLREDILRDHKKGKTVFDFPENIQFGSGAWTAAYTTPSVTLQMFSDAALFDTLYGWANVRRSRDPYPRWSPEDHGRVYKFMLIDEKWAGPFFYPVRVRLSDVRNLWYEAGRMHALEHDGKYKKPEAKDFKYLIQVSGVHSGLLGHSEEKGEATIDDLFSAFERAGHPRAGYEFSLTPDGPTIDPRTPLARFRIGDLRKFKLWTRVTLR